MTSSPAAPTLPGDPAAMTAFVRQAAALHPTDAKRQLLPFLEQLIAQPPGADLLFELLELSRTTMAAALAEAARSYLNKPLPLSPGEAIGFAEVIAGLRLMARGYTICLGAQPAAGDDPQQARHLATLLHRCLHYTGAIIFEHYRVRRELPNSIWLNLHDHYGNAEQLGIAQISIDDPLEAGPQSSNCAAAYITFLLIDIASPYSQGLRQLNLIRRWAGMWAPLVSIHRLEDDLELPPYVVELQRALPLHQIGNAEALQGDTRWLDTTRLGLQIHHHLSQLQQRINPSQLGLGEESSGLVTQLLVRLGRPWTQIASPRRFRRFSSGGTSQVATTFDDMYANIARQEFRQPMAAVMYSHRAYNHLATFGEQVIGELADKKAVPEAPAPTFPSESWQVVNHSANGFRLANDLPRQRIAHNQLLATCPHDGTIFLLCRVTWLMQEENGALLAGLVTLPGIPQAISVRPAQSQEPFAPAFLLDPLPAMQEGASLVLQPGSYQTRKLLEIIVGEKRQNVRLLGVMEKGSDFDRVGYELA